MTSRVLDHEGLEPTNNPAERALRHTVIDRKIKFHTWSDAGMRFVERMATLRTTAMIRGRSAAAHLKSLFEAAFDHRPLPTLFDPG